MIKSLVWGFKLIFHGAFGVSSLNSYNINADQVTRFSILAPKSANPEASGIFP